MTRTAPIINLVTERLRAFAEPAPLQILQMLRAGEYTVGEPVLATGLVTASETLAGR